MKKVLTTFAFGQHSDLLDVSLPTFRRYAAIHGYDLYVPAGSNFAANDRPFAWLKIPTILALLESGYQAVLWMDADVTVIKHDKDILKDAGHAPLAMAVQHTPDGAVPSTGVWVVRDGAQPLLREAWSKDSFQRSSCWWEQAAVIDRLGGDPDATPVLVPPGPMWHELPYEWNPHIRDARGIAGCRFFHATGFADRRAAMLELLQ
jgi:hypothetical protein